MQEDISSDISGTPPFFNFFYTLLVISFHKCLDYNTKNKIIFIFAQPYLCAIVVFCFITIKYCLNQQCHFVYDDLSGSILIALFSAYIASSAWVISLILLLIPLFDFIMKNKYRWIGR